LEFPVLACEEFASLFPTGLPGGFVKNAIKSNATFDKGDLLEPEQQHKRRTTTASKTTETSKVTMQTICRALRVLLAGVTVGEPVVMLFGVFAWPDEAIMFGTLSRTPQVAKTKQKITINATMDQSLHLLCGLLILTDCSSLCCCSTSSKSVDTITQNIRMELQ